MADLPPDIGATLGKLRLMAGMSQVTVAPNLRVDQSRISRIENGEGPATDGVSRKVGGRLADPVLVQKS